MIRWRCQRPDCSGPLLVWSATTVRCPACGHTAELLEPPAPEPEAEPRRPRPRMVDPARRRRAPTRSF